MTRNVRLVDVLQVGARAFRGVTFHHSVLALVDLDFLDGFLFLFRRWFASSRARSLGHGVRGFLLVCRIFDTPLGCFP